MRILFAEDEAKTAAFVKKGLESHSIAVDLAEDGEKALYMASVSEYDVILLDIMLPKVDGVETCQKLRSRGLKTPVIMLTARLSVDDKIRALDSGADDYVTKPFSFSELFARIRAVARRKEMHLTPQIHIDDLVIDTNKCLVLRAGKTVDLSPREYRLLEFLVKNKGRVLNRFDILENVWGAGDRNLSNVVDVHVSHLRAKIDRGYAKELIRTVRGGGYMIDG